MTNLYDFTPFEFLLLAMHVLSIVFYTALGVKIIQLKRYLKWNRHIYPRMMIAAFGFACVFLYDLVYNQHQYSMVFNLFAWLIAINQFSELYRLVDKYDRITELENIIKTMKTKALMILLLILTLTSCGSRKAEIERLQQESKQKTENYEKKISELNSKITETEQKVTTSKTELEQKQSEITKLREQRDELQEKLNKEESDDIVIKDATGTVKITDKNGNTYEIPAGQGTEIMKTSISKLQTEKKQVSELLSKEQEHSSYLAQSLQSAENTIRYLESDVKSKENLIKEQESQLESKTNQLNKQVERKAYPLYMWIGVGMLLMVAIQMLIKAYNPFNKLKSLWKQL